MAATLHRDVTASGVRLRVAESGSGPCVVLIHGLFVDHTSWDRVTELMAERFRVIAPDLPGFGASEKPPPNRFPYGVDAFAEAVADLYAGLEIGRAAVVGHALGGAVALTLAARHPELVSRLILIDSLCYSAHPRVLRRIASIPFVGGLVFKQFLGRALFRAHFRKTMLSEGAVFDSTRIDGYYRAFNSPAARGSALATLRNTVDTRPIVAQTSRIQTPSLVLWGRSDRLYPPSLGQRLSREIRDARFELIDAGHAPQEERPELLAAHLRRFLEAKLPR